MDGDCHQRLVGRHIEEFPTVMGPLGLLASSAGDLPFAARREECLDIDLPLTRFIRHVCNPPPVWGYTRIGLVELRPQDRLWFLISHKRHRPYIPIRPEFICAVDNIASVVGPIGNNTVDDAVHEPPFFRTADQRLLEQVWWQAVTWRSKDYPAPIRSPDRTEVVVSERETRRNAACTFSHTEKSVSDSRRST